MGKQKQLGSGLSDLDTVLPANIDAEKTILGAILLDNEAFYDDSLDLTPDDFSIDSHRRIYLRMNDILFGLVEGSSHVDIVTLANELDRNKEIESVGGVAYLASLTEGLPMRPVIDDYIRIVRDKSRLRKIMQICSAAIARAADQSETALSVIGVTENALAELVAGDNKSDAVHVGDIVHGVESSIIAKRNQSIDKTALDLTWGVEELDAFTKGLFGGELTILGGESGSGKTAMMLQIVLSNALQGIPCGIFSMEMSKEKLLQRLYPQLSNIIQSKHIRDPRLLNIHTDVPEIQRLSKIIAGLPIWIDDTSPMTLPKLKARAKMMIRRRKIRLFVGDYFQLIEVPGAIGVEKIERVAFGMRDFAKSEPNVHTLLLSQYSKASGFMKKQRRTKADLMGGSAIHHAAQNVVLLTVESALKRDADALLDAEWLIDKQRDGLTGRVTGYYDRRRLRFIGANQEEKKDDSNSGSASNASQRIGQ